MSTSRRGFVAGTAGFAATLFAPAVAQSVRLAGTPASPAPAARRPVIRIGAASSPKYGAVFDAMRRDFDRSGIGLEYTLYRDYLQLVDALLRREVDIAWNTPMAHARAMILTGGRVIGLVARDIDIQYAAQVVVRKDTGLNDIKDLVGRKVALGSIESAELNALPRYFLKQQGLDLQSQASIVDLDGLVDDQMSPLSAATNVLAAVMSGAADAGAVGEVTTRAIRTNPDSPLKVIWTSPRYTHCIMTALEGYNPELGGLFRKVLLAETMDDPIGKEVLVNEGNDARWKDASSKADAEEGFMALVAAIKEQGIPLVAPSPDPAKPKFNVGAVSSTESLRALDAMQRYFRRQGESQFEYVLHGTSEQLLDALLARRIDVAWTGPLPYVQRLLRDDRIVPVLASDSEVNYHFQVVVRKDSRIAALRDLDGRRLVLGSEERPELSCLPRLYLQEAGLDLKTVEVVSLSGATDPATRTPADDDRFVADAVRNGRGDAGIIGDEFAKTLSAGGNDVLTTIWTSPAFARRTMAALPDYRDLGRFVQVLQTMTPSDPTGKLVLALDGGTRFVADLDSRAYQDLRRAVGTAPISVR